MSDRRRVESSGGGVAGFQLPIGADEQAVREVLMARIREIVRKKRGGAGYVLYAPNRGKKGKPKKAGEFPTRAQAKAAELARFPPRDPDRLEKARKYVKGLRRGRRKEAIERLTDRLVEVAEGALREDDPAIDELPPQGPDDAADAPPPDDVPADDSAEGDVDPEAPVEPAPEEDASRWDQILSSLSHDALQKDSRLRSFRNRIESQAGRALERAVKSAISSADQKVERLSAGADRLGRQFISFRVHTEDSAVGPLYAVVVGDRLEVMVGPEVKASAAKISPEDGQALKALLDSLPEEFDGSKIRDAIDQRDEYLDGVEGRLDDVLADLDALELTVLKRLIADKYAGGGTP